jgi:ABC-2 type transport system ATP-binding protein
MSGVAVRTHGLSKAYGTTKALVDLDLEVEPGQCFGFLGPNGAGKSTTIRLLLGLQRPTAGRASVLGLDPIANRTDLLARVGYLPGELELYRRMTGRAHVDWFARARGLEDRSTASELIERFAVVMDRPVKELSKGNRQKIGLVLACMHRPELLVLDEPTSGLDPLMQQEFERLVREVVAEGRTVFLSSHELDEVQRVADRVGIIRTGHLVTTDSVEHLRRTAPRRVEATFAGEVDADELSRVDGVTVTASTPTRVTLEVTGAIGPVLALIAARDPIDVTARHADLEELFLELYGDDRDRKEATRAG